MYAIRSYYDLKHRYYTYLRRSSLPDCKRNRITSYNVCYTKLLRELTGLVSGNSYYIRVDGENDLTGDFDIEVIDGINNWPTVPQQDCSSATLICNQQTIVGDPGFLGAGSTCDYTTPYGCFSFGT